uniref:WRKY19-like zinc finger domain-containing protein n=1 Tax=viral metagenome TaxID=1070528 RepID=A0A6C0DLB6_9ZZZZ
MSICKDCSKQSSFGYNKPEYCKLHKKENMTNIKDKRCKEQECNKFALGKTDFCRKHGGGNRCKEDGCNKGAEGKTDFCISHGGGKRCKEDGCKSSTKCKTGFCISHGGGKRCKEDGCKSGASGKTDFCKKHGGGKRCIEDGCNNSARSKYDFCVSHGGGKRCKEQDCNKGSEGKTDFCKKHGGGKRCIQDGCNNSATGKSNFCISHGGGNRCPNCIGWVDSRSGCQKYDGYCATCFKVLFPDDERSKVVYRHTKEIRVRNEINSHFKGFIHDKPLYTGNCDCTHRRRIDHRKLIGNTILAIETDEFAHSGYDPLDEEIRYDDLYMIHSGKWIFIRFNPDGGKVDLEDKLKVLIREIEEQIRRIENEENEVLLDIVKLYY